MMPTITKLYTPNSTTRTAFVTPRYLQKASSCTSNLGSNFVDSSFAQPDLKAIMLVSYASWLTFRPLWTDDMSDISGCITMFNEHASFADSCSKTKLKSVQSDIQYTCTNCGKTNKNQKRASFKRSSATMERDHLFVECHFLTLTTTSANPWPHNPLPI